MHKSSAGWTSSSGSEIMSSLSKQGSTGKHSARERPPKSSSLASTVWQLIASTGKSEADCQAVRSCSETAKYSPSHRTAI